MCAYFSRLLIIVLFSSIGYSANAICVSSAITNLRTGPGPKFPTSWTVSKFTPLVEISRKGGWVQVQDLDGEKHWVYGQNVTNKFICVAVRIPSARLRKSPNGELADLRQVDKYTAFKRLDINGEWIEVEAAWGETYWVHENTVWRPVKVSNINF